MRIINIQVILKNIKKKGESENVVEYKQRGGGMRMNHTEKTIPVWKKYSLNVSEAAEESHHSVRTRKW